MPKTFLAGAIALVAVGALSIAANFQDHHGDKKDQKPADARPAATAVEVPFFGNAKCPISGEAVDKAVFADLKGQRVYFCCKKCLAKGQEDAAKTLEKAYPADKVVEVKNASCPVMGEKIGDKERGKNTVVVMGYKLELCCDDCQEDVKKSPITYIAIAKNPKLSALGNAKCPISDKDVSHRDVAIFNGKIVGLCCPRCVEAFQKDPEKALAAAEKSVPKREKKH